MIKKIRYIMDKPQKVKLVILFFLILFGAIVELLGVSIILPIINVAMNPEVIESNEVIKKITELFKIKSSDQFLIFVCLCAIILYAFKNSYLILLNALTYKLIYNNQRKMSQRIMNCYLDTNYLFHVDHNVAELQVNIVTITTKFYKVIQSSILLLSESMISLLLLILLLITDIFTTIVIAIMMILSLGIFLKLYRRKQKELGRAFKLIGTKINKCLLESFGSIKEIKAMGKEKFFQKYYEKISKEYTDILRKNDMRSYIPHPVMESIIIISLLILIIIQIIKGTDFQSFIPTLSIFAMAAMRMLPSFNRITTHINNILYNMTSVNHLYEDITQIEELEADKKILQKNEILTLDKEIKISNLNFKYPNTSNDIVHNINMHIPAKTSVAFIGKSGAGKTTIADILLGVIIPNTGSVYVDGFDVFENLIQWHDMIGYIPQSIYLLDDTIRNNIAFGVDEKNIDNDEIMRAVKEAQLTDFVTSLSNGLDTKVGEQGVRLSGGQRQRIGIARALYRKPKVLVMDEATSALDEATENLVIEAIENLHGKCTLIVIAHRLSTISKCDLVFEVKDGKIKKVR